MTKTTKYVLVGAAALAVGVYLYRRGKTEQQTTTSSRLATVLSGLQTIVKA